MLRDLRERMALQHHLSNGQLLKYACGIVVLWTMILYVVWIDPLIQHGRLLEATIQYVELSTGQTIKRTFGKAPLVPPVDPN